MKHLLEYSEFLNEGLHTVLAKINKNLIGTHGTGLPNGCSGNDINDLRKRSVNELGYNLDSGYIDFLKKCDGLDYNGVLIYSSKKMPTVMDKWPYIWGFVDANILWETDMEFIHFGHSGISFFIYNQNSKKFEIRDKPVITNLIKTFTSFNDMLVYILK